MELHAHIKILDHQLYIFFSILYTTAYHANFTYITISLRGSFSSPLGPLRTSGARIFPTAVLLFPVLMLGRLRN